MRVNWIRCLLSWKIRKSKYEYVTLDVNRFDGFYLLLRYSAEDIIVLTHGYMVWSPK